ncbi:hypothetical protein R1sor_010198 [Riccia sorocarpa]|uniref:Uncharacterized protein n=1 Tax=Riccia sorocarpa TaxID=122646 RepID=A0ABD3HXA9_9MARC
MDNFTGVIPQSWKRAKRGRIRSAYERLNKRPGKSRTERLGKKKRSWRLRLPKIKVRILSPLTLLGRLRDAYVRMMMNLANRYPCSPPSITKGGSKSSRKKHFFTEAELLCLEYLKRDTNFMIQAAKAHAEAQARAAVILGDGNYGGPIVEDKAFRDV